MGFFGPIGVGAIFYLSVSQEYLRNEVLNESGTERADAAHLRETMTVVIWFLVVCSVVSPRTFALDSSNQFQIVHGLTIPLVKLGIFIPGTFQEGESVNISRR